MTNYKPNTHLMCVGESEAQFIIVIIIAMHISVVFIKLEKTFVQYSVFLSHLVFSSYLHDYNVLCMLLNFI